MPYIDVAGERLFYSTSRPETGTVHSLVCIHGSGGSHQHWPAQLRTLKDFRVIAVDLPGHGRSDGGGRETVHDYAVVIEGLVESMSLDRVTLIGHSLGGAIVQLLALEAPPWLDRIILVGTGARLRVAPDILHALQGPAGPVANLISNWAFGPSASAPLVDAVRLELLRTPVAVTRGDYKACDRFDILSRVADIHLPALVISGNSDRLTPPKYGDYLTAKITGARHVIIPDAGHMMALEFPGAFVAHVVSFMEPKPYRTL